MCPICLTTLALAAAGATTMGGLTALVTRKFFKRNRSAKNKGEPNECHTVR